MTPQYHPFLANGPSGDPVVYVAFRFSKRAILFDLGDITALPVKKILRITDVFVSHMHVDHLIGFDHLLRVLIGRARRVRLFGPEGLIAAIGHKLAAYSWNLAHRVPGNLTFIVTETAEDGTSRRAEFRLADRFRASGESTFPLDGDIVHAEEALTVRRASLDHGIPSIAYALQERSHVNLWKNRLDALGLGTGPWLNELKAAALRGDPDDRIIRAAWKTPGGVAERNLPLGLLRRECLRFEPGQKIAYVTDARHTQENQRRIVALARDADLLFIETTFAAGEDALALERGHLTAGQAGRLARRAGARRAEPMHISPRYAGVEDQILAQFARAFAGQETPSAGA
ncbi:MBL fold metallo-hydrolase [Actibacterium sp. MT2.3-13A]|uniref:ribonuclease Z n=1 Tax=Actibacterium sp. MT2.3-13A TaxID=2828332 RepID=UPI001BAC021D|nr:MBL fold metallo-hydrolase [Actibacterium sp. MT2.3-13A]